MTLDKAEESFQTSRSFGDQNDVIGKEKTSDGLAIKGKAQGGGGECFADVTDVESKQPCLRPLRR